MRKRLTLGLPVILAAGMLIAPAGFAADKSGFTADEIYDPFGYMGKPVGEFVSAGTANCPGHEPIGNPTLPPCPADSRTHIRSGVLVSRVSSKDARVAGWMTVELNANWNILFEGPIWGTFSIMLDSGGSWAGTWQGKRVYENGSWTGTLNVRGKGIGGSVDGMIMMAEDHLKSFIPMPVAYVGDIEGVIIEPK
jgi:hypothetical protein